MMMLKLGFAYLPLILLLVVVAAPPVTSQAQSLIRSSLKGQKGTAARDLSRHSCNKDLSKCTYDCNSDCDCKDGLVCYQRESGKGKGKGKSSSSSNYFNYGGFRDLEIPGCVGTVPNFATNYYDDYCIDPDDFPNSLLWYVGSDGDPAFVYPLKECWGDCDDDYDCAGNLVCYHRDGHSTNEVPGCLGDPVKNIYYCVNPLYL